MRLPSAAVLGLGLLLAAEASDFTPYSNCGFTGALLGLQLGGCREWPCIFKRGVPIEAEVLFKAMFTYTKLKTTIIALFGGISIPLYLDEQMCERLLFGVCPASVGDTMSYLANMTVSSDLPTIDVTLEWLITKADGETVVCAQVPAQFH